MSHGRQDIGGRIIIVKLSINDCFSGDYCAHAADYDDISMGSDNALTFSEEEMSNNSDDCFSYCTEFR